MTSSEIRKQFIDFFISKQHKFVPGSGVVPFDDPTLLFSNAGMNQFKDVFLGTGARDYSRAVNSQKCIRVSGKHNDLEEVGYDTYHHTFFEMLGNWSFGDYYKRDAIAWAWELLTEVWKLPKERLFASVYKTDDEAFELWKTVTDINPSHILRFGEKDNFWEMGETGPCGPCSEIHINLTDDPDDGSLVNAGSPDCIEIWNLVFIQYNRDEHGKLHELPQKHVDTGMGFERVCRVIQGKSSNYDTDVFTPLINQIEKLSGGELDTEEKRVASRVIADHIRTLSFAVADGAMPGNDGRGYVLRRILRRASRYGRKINLKEPFLYKLVALLGETMGEIFPEISEKREFVERIIKGEEESFNRTLDRGIELFEVIAENLRKTNGKTVPGSEAFKLYDTYGFPLDLTAVMAKEEGFEVDEQGFNALMFEQKERAREATRAKIASVNVNTLDLDSLVTDSLPVTEFVGYNSTTSRSNIIGFREDAETDLVVLDKTPFYVEAGGQIDDLGDLVLAGTRVHVLDVAKHKNRVVHFLEKSESVKYIQGMEVIADVDAPRRKDIMRNHSATHYMHSALRKILGTHIQQAGSYVGPDRLRFDFNHFQKVSVEEIREIEQMVNEELRKSTPLQHHRNVPIDQAKEMGALMFFGDKYGDFVNVVQFGDFSIEFCGGIHVPNSAEIGLFKILSESSIASGVRRIEAITGVGTEQYLYQQLMKVKEKEENINDLLDQKKKLEKELQEMLVKQQALIIPELVSKAVDISGVPVVIAKLQVDSADTLKSLGEMLKDKMGTGIGFLAAAIQDKVSLVCCVSDDLVKSRGLSAGKIVGEAAKVVGGGGGGRPNLAQAGGKDINKVDELVSMFPEMVKNFLS